MPIEGDNDGGAKTEGEGDGVSDNVVDNEGSTAAGGCKPMHENDRRQPNVYGKSIFWGYLHVLEYTNPDTSAPLSKVRATNSAFPAILTDGDEAGASATRFDVLPKRVYAEAMVGSTTLTVL